MPTWALIALAIYGALLLIGLVLRPITRRLEQISTQLESLDKRLEQANVWLGRLDEKGDSIRSTLNWSAERERS